MADACRTGAATDIIFGLALGYKSTIIPCLCIATAIYVSFTLASMYGIAIAALGMLTTLSTGELFGRGGSMRVRGGAGRCGLLGCAHGNSTGGFRVRPGLPPGRQRRGTG